MARLLNRVRMTTATTGTGTVTLGSAVATYATFAEASAVDGGTYSYLIEDGDDYEIGRGTYTASGTTFSRDTVIASKISGTAGTSKINLSGSAEIAVTALQEDIRDQASLAFVINGNGSTIATGQVGNGLVVPFACEVTEWSILADQSGSIVIDIWKDTYANYPPTDLDSITASAPPTLSSATKATSSSLTGWITAIAVNDILTLNVDSVTSVQEITLVLKVRKT